MLLLMSVSLYLVVTTCGTFVFANRAGFEESFIAGGSWNPPAVVESKVGMEGQDAIAWETAGKLKVSADRPCVPGMFIVRSADWYAMFGDRLYVLYGKNETVSFSSF